MLFLVLVAIACMSCMVADAFKLPKHPCLPVDPCFDKIQKVAKWTVANNDFSDYGTGTITSVDVMTACGMVSTSDLMHHHAIIEYELQLQLHRTNMMMNPTCNVVTVKVCEDLMNGMYRFEEITSDSNPTDTCQTPSKSCQTFTVSATK